MLVKTPQYKDIPFIHKIMFSIHFIIFYASFLVFPFLILFIWLFTKKFPLWILLPFIFLSFVFIYARFIEPYLLFLYEEKLSFSRPGVSTQQSKQKPLRIAVFSDPHLGVYKKADFLKKIVEKVNEQKPDLVLIPGDFVYHISKKDLLTMFADLKNIEAPVYAVTGNHDAKQPGEYSSDEVRAMVEPHDVNVIDNEKTSFNVAGRKITLVGLSDIWEGKTEYQLAENLQSETLNIVLVHNPDAAYDIPNKNVDLVVAGHTHGGQIRIPFVYKYAIPTKYDFDRGFYNIRGMKVFVTSGAGEVGLPMRLGVPPEIVVLEVE